MYHERQPAQPRSHAVALKPTILITMYLMAALLALVLTWVHVPAYLGQGVIEANRLFWSDALFNSNAAGRFLTIDVLFLAFVCSVLMFIEGRRLRIRFLYLYILSGALIAISVAFPLFLAAREVQLRKAKHTSGKQDPSEIPAGGSIDIGDVIALLVLFALALSAGLSIL